MFASCAYTKIKRFCADKDYRGTFIYDAYALLSCRVFGEYNSYELGDRYD